MSNTDRISSTVDLDAEIIRAVRGKWVKLWIYRLNTAGSVILLFLVFKRLFKKVFTSALERKSSSLGFTRLRLMTAEIIKRLKKK